MDHKKSSTNDQLPPSIGDAPPNYYDIYPDKDVEPPPVDVSSPGNVTTTDTDNVVSNDNNIEPLDLSRIGTITHSFNEREVGSPMKKFLWKFLLVWCVIGLIINPPVGLHGLIWTCIAYHSSPGDARESSLMIGVCMCIASYVMVFIAVIIIIVVFTVT